MSKAHIIAVQLFLSSIILIYFLLPVRALAQGIEPVKPPPPKPMAQSEWAEKRSNYLTLYNSNSVEKRLKSVEFISAQLYERLIISDIRYASEVMEFLLQILAVEADDNVIKAATESLAKFLSQSAYMEWAVKNHKKLAVKEPAQLGLLDALSGIAKASLSDNALAVALDLIDKDQPARVRLSAMALMARGPSTKCIEVMLELARDADTNIRKSALNILAGFKPMEKAGALIKMLSEEKRSDIRQEIGRALEIITNQKFGTDANAWQKWWNNTSLGRVDFQAGVDAAINQGVDYLVKQDVANDYYDELIFYTLIKSGVKIPDATMEPLLNKMLNKRLEKTYNVALLAMALSDLDRVKYQDRIVQCAEFLLAGQNSAGNWHYGFPIIQYVNTPSSKPISPTDGTSTRSIRRVAIKMPPRRVKTDYDNSCTQYALLGLRACADAYIEIPKQVWADAEKHLLSTQDGDGGWCYTTGPGYGSMTAGGLGGLAICKFYLNKDIRGDKNIKRATDWITQNFTVRENPKYSSWHYYYLYALERAGIFAGTEQFGGNEWYPLGANYLLNEQKANGSWGDSPNQDTCFAILFLRRATKPLKIEITPGGPSGQPAGGPSSGTDGK